MKFLTFKDSGKYKVGVLKDERVYSLEKLEKPIYSMEELIEDYDLIKEEIVNLLNSNDSIAYKDIQYAGAIPFPKQDVICLGINYDAHAEESSRYKKTAFEKNREKTIYFSKRVNEAVPDFGVIDGHLDIVDSLDYEVELAVVIGKDCRNVLEKDAKNYIFGYTILNDMSARNLQTEHKQWYFGKGLDDFTPIGPVIATKDEFAYPPELNIRSYINDEIRQDSNTSMFIANIDNVIEELSRGMTLKVGTIIAMGTPAGVGMGFEPPKFLKKGDKVVCEIEEIGKITNTIG